MVVNIDESQCTGCGLCEQICVTVFVMGDDGLAHVLKQPDASEEAAVKDAVASCPVTCIRSE
ncbi:MAG: ferredoxin [bacterium]|nr:ferredoxin [bacterium]